MDDFKILLQAIIDNSSLSNAQKQIAKEKFVANLDVSVDINKFASEKKKISEDFSKLANEIDQAFKNIGIELNTKQLNSFTNEYINGIKQATKEQEKLNNSQKKHDLKIQEKYYKRIIDNNKSIYSLKKKLLEADQKQTKEIEHQIGKLERRNGYNYTELDKRGLKSNDWEREVNASIDILENQYKINSAKKDDLKISKQIEQANKIRLSYDNGHGSSEYQNRLTKIIQEFEKYGVSADEASQKTEKLRNILNGFKVNGEFLPDDQLVAQADKLEAEFKAVKISVEEAKLSYDKFTQPVSKEKATSLIMRINTFLSKNTAITKEARVELESYVSELGKGVNLNRWNELNNKFEETKNRMRGLGKLGASLKNQIEQAAESFTQWLSVSSGIMLLVSSVKNAVNELKELDNILTEISKTSDLTEQELKKLGDTAFESASEYGKKASDYLIGVQEMYRAGFDNAEEMAKLSILAQSAGDMDSTLSNDYILATNAAYKYKGSVEELNKVLDSQNYITNNAAVSMKDMADATTETASVAAQYGVEIDELSALIATATANTRESGSEVGTALKSILINLQDTTSKPVTETFDALGISMTKVVNGAETLKTPIELIYELADAYNSLPEGDIMRANILNEIGQKRHANTLAAVLSDMDGLNHMLELYNSNLADNSAYNEAMKSANNWQGSLNKLKNSWTDLVQNFANSDAIIKAINMVDGLVKAVDKLGAVGTIGLGAGLFAGIKNVGEGKKHPSIVLNSQQQYVFFGIPKFSYCHL